jgi:hypothetical protein
MSRGGGVHERALDMHVMLRNVTASDLGAFASTI